MDRVLKEERSRSVRHAEQQHQSLYQTFLPGISNVTLRVRGYYGFYA